MDPAGWVRLQSLFLSALELPMERTAAFLDEPCIDPALRREVKVVQAARDDGGVSDTSASPNRIIHRGLKPSTILHHALQPPNTLDPTRSAELHSRR